MIIIDFHYTHEFININVALSANYVCFKRDPEFFMYNAIYKCVLFYYYYHYHYYWYVWPFHPVYNITLNYLHYQSPRGVKSIFVIFLNA